jgi:hypothetical protein
VCVPCVSRALEPLLQVIFVCPAASADVPCEGGLLTSEGGPLQPLDVFVHDGVSWSLTPRRPPANQQSSSLACPAATSSPAHHAGTAI